MIFFFLGKRTAQVGGAGHGAATGHRKRTWRAPPTKSHMLATLERPRMVGPRPGKPRRLPLEDDADDIAALNAIILAVLEDDPISPL